MALPYHGFTWFHLLDLCPFPFSLFGNNFIFLKVSFISESFLLLLFMLSPSLESELSQLFTCSALDTSVPHGCAAVHHSVSARVRQRQHHQHTPALSLQVAISAADRSRNDPNISWLGFLSQPHARVLHAFSPCCPSD